MQYKDDIFCNKIFVFFVSNYKTSDYRVVNFK